jgi:hypothetical protein
MRDHPEADRFTRRAAANLDYPKAIYRRFATTSIGPRSDSWAQLEKYGLSLAGIDQCRRAMMR